MLQPDTPRRVSRSELYHAAECDREERGEVVNDPAANHGRASPAVPSLR
jgi:hypothetical protein